MRSAIQNLPLWFSEMSEDISNNSRFFKDQSNQILTSGTDRKTFNWLISGCREGNRRRNVQEARARGSGCSLPPSYQPHSCPGCTGWTAPQNSLVTPHHSPDPWPAFVMIILLSNSWRRVLAMNFKALSAAKILIMPFPFSLRTRWKKNKTRGWWYDEKMSFPFLFLGMTTVDPLLQFTLRLGG